MAASAHTMWPRPPYTTLCKYANSQPIHGQLQNNPPVLTRLAPSKQLHQTGTLKKSALWVRIACGLPLYWLCFGFNLILMAAPNKALSHKKAATEGCLKYLKHGFISPHPLFSNLFGAGWRWCHQRHAFELIH